MAFESFKIFNKTEKSTPTQGQVALSWKIFFKRATKSALRHLKDKFTLMLSVVTNHPEVPLCQHWWPYKLTYTSPQHDNMHCNFKRKQFLHSWKPAY